MSTHVDTRRILIFLAFAFGIAWATALVIYLTGGLVNSPNLGLPGLTLATVLMALPYMFAPALAHVLTRLLTREGWMDTSLRPRFAQGAWKYWLIAWLLPPVLIALGAVIYFVIFPQHFDITMQSYIDASLAAVEAQGVNTGGVSLTGEQLRFFALLGLASAFIVAPLINSIFTFGEEFGWRGYLQRKLMPLGRRVAIILMGIIWGVWHWPVIWMGYEYGFEYPGAPFVGPLLFVWIAFTLGAIIGWLALKGRSVWPAVIAHAMFNGFAGGSVYFLRGEPNVLLGPLPVGIIASIPMTLLTLWIIFSPNALSPVEEFGTAADAETAEEDLVTKPA